MPALLLRDKPPEWKPCFLEYLKGLWTDEIQPQADRAQYPEEQNALLMSVLGITGCTGLIVAAFTLKHGGQNRPVHV